MERYGRIIHLENIASSNLKARKITCSALNV